MLGSVLMLSKVFWCHTKINFCKTALSLLLSWANLLPHPSVTINPVTNGQTQSAIFDLPSVAPPVVNLKTNSDYIFFPILASLIGIFRLKFNMFGLGSVRDLAPGSAVLMAGTHDLALILGCQDAMSSLSEILMNSLMQIIFKVFTKYIKSGNSDKKGGKGNYTHCHPTMYQELC